MNDHTDSQLLRAFAEHRSEPAFAELVRRHVDLVHSAAQRMVRDSHLAQDVTQGVFVVLANNAAQLAAYPVLSGWLHRTAQNIAAQVVRTDVRRRAREQEAAAMNELLADTPDAPWEHIALHLDAALGELADADRDAVLLRYFERKSAREMAGMLGISDEAAQKRVNRSVERLREIFARRGVSVGAGALAVVITTNAVQAAPVGMAVAISAVALAGTTFTTATQTIAMTTLQKTLVAATLAAAVGVGIYEARQASQLRAQISVDRARRTTLPAPNDAAFAALQQKAEQLAAQNAELSNALTQASADKTRLETAYQQSKRSTALFQELAAQAAAKDTNPTNAYPTVRHAWAGIGKLGRLSAQSKQDDGSLSAEEKAAIKAAQSNFFEEFQKILKAMKQLDADQPGLADTAKDDPVDSISCLLYGALGLDERQFGEVFSLVQRYHHQAKQFKTDGDTSAAENPGFKQLMEAGKTELVSILKPEQARIFEAIAPQLQFTPDNFNFNFDIPDK